MPVNPDGMSSISNKEPWSSHETGYLSQSNLAYSKHYTCLHTYTYKSDNDRHAHRDTHACATKHKPLLICLNSQLHCLLMFLPKTWCKSQVSFMYMAQNHLYQICQSAWQSVQSVHLLHPWKVWYLVFAINVVKLYWNLLLFAFLLWNLLSVAT